jgi:hypothetical protein
MATPKPMDCGEVIMNTGKGSINASWLLVLVIAVTIANPVRAEVPLLDVVGAWGGPVNAVDVAPGGGIAYVGAGRRVVVLDISDVSHIVELSSVDMVQSVKDVKYRDGHVYAVCKAKPYRDLSVIDVSNPRDAHLVWTPPSSVAGQGVEVNFRDHWAYVRTGTGGAGDLEVYDIANPTNVSFLGHAIALVVGDVVINGDLAYVAGGNNAIQFKVFNIATPNPLNPQVVGSVQLVSNNATGHPVCVAVNGNRAYVTYRSPGLQTNTFLAIVDISSPSTPLILTNTELPSTPTGIIGLAAEAGHVFAVKPLGPDSIGGNGFPTWSTAYPGLMVFDVTSTPDVPVQVATYKDHAGIDGVKVFGDRAYLFDYGEGLVVLDISNPARPARLGNYHSPAYFGRMTKVGDLLYVSDYWNGLTILNVSNPSAPALLGVYQTPLGPSGENLGVNNWGIAVQGNCAYLAAGRDSVHVVDVSDPTSPALIQKLLGFPDPWRSTDLVRRGSLLHVAFEDALGDPGTEPWRFRTYDLAPPANYAVLSTLQTLNGIAPRVLAASDVQPVVFCGVRHEPMQTIDVSNPAAPALIYQANEPDIDASYDVAAEGSLHLRCTNLTQYPYEQDGLYFSDVSKPANPVPISFVHGRYAMAVAMQNGRVYAVGDFNAAGPGGLPAGVPELPYSDGMDFVVFDVADPAKPTAIAWSPYVGSYLENNGVFTDEPYIFVSTFATGLAGFNGGEDGQGLMILRLPQALCMADVNGDWTVNIDDLLFVISNWGQGAGNPSDVNNDNIVNISDLLAVIGAWGQCG